MTTSPHVYLRASAGTGKTWQLSSHFLRLLFRGVDPARVLATTFTRKAAGEIQERVLERLLGALEDPAALAALAELSPARSIGRAECAELLARLARESGGFRVLTLDAFFAELARVFALDLDLGPQWRIASEIEDQELRAEALAAVLAGLRADERAALLSGLQKERASSSVHASLLRIVAAAHGLHKESAAEAWRACPLPRQLDADELAGWLARLDAIEAPRNKGKDAKPDANWRKGLEKLRQAACAADWSSFAGQSLVAYALDGRELYSGKPIADEVRDVIAALMMHEAVPSVGRLLARQTVAARDLLERFDAHYLGLQREGGVVRFDDLPRALCPGGGGTRRPLDERELDLWFRLDGRIDHLLFDEFQDTAPLQWRALQPLAEEVLADGTGERSFFCVGDEKQSIYGWRDAEPRLFAGLLARYPALVAAEPLSTSRRSSQIVLDTANLVFGALASSPVLAGEGALASGAAVAERWARGYVPHVAWKAKRGSARLLRAARREEAEEGPKPELELAVERVVAIAGRARGASVGVLVRTRKHIGWLISKLRDRGVDASGEGGTPLVDSEPVQVLLSALHLADHPGDSAAAFHVRTSPFARALGLERPGVVGRVGRAPGEAGSGRDDGPESAESDAARASRELRARLAHEGYGALASSLLPVVDSVREWAGWDRERYGQLVDLAHAYDQGSTLRPTDFARLVRETPVEARSDSRVRVMTIHASKGLEFDAVVLPELGEPLAKKRDGWIGLRRDPFGAVERVSARPSEWLAQYCPELAEITLAAEERELSDSLCVLYVAMTRARHCLEMLLPPPTKDGTSTAKTFARLLASALEGVAETQPSGEEVLWRHPESRDDWFEGAAIEDAADAAPGAARAPVIELAPSRHARIHARRSASGAQDGAPDPARLLAPRESAATRRGSVLHRWLEECEWIEDFAADDEGLLAIAEPIEPDFEARRAALALLRTALARPAIRALLSRPAGCEHVVERERRFALIEAEAEGLAHWNGAIDRLVVRTEAGRPVSAVVIDFKTDAVGADAIEERVEFHRPQLEAYRRVAARVCGLALEDVTARVAFLAPGVVVDLAGR